MTYQKTIAVDFDGVISTYESGWTGPVPIDPPVPGARAGIAALRGLGFRVEVFSCRALTHEGRYAIESWLTQHGITVDKVTGWKPHAVLYVDDRGYRFTGDWEAVALVAKAVPPPWNAERQAAAPVVAPFAPLCKTCGGVVRNVRPRGVYEECGHPVPGAEAAS